jgi:hypothetical protein
MNEEDREFFEFLIDKLIEQALDHQKLVRRLDERNAEMANANRDLIQENLRLSTEVAELKTRLEIKTINQRISDDGYAEG